jgi:hypothetical protein
MDKMDLFDKYLKCPDNASIAMKRVYKQINNDPYKYILKSIKFRCENPNCERYKNYGGRGIKCLITKEEIKELWYRDKAYEMKKPSIDRIENNGNMGKFTLCCKTITNMC